MSICLCKLIAGNLEAVSYRIAELMSLLICIKSLNLLLDYVKKTLSSSFVHYVGQEKLGISQNHGIFTKLSSSKLRKAYMYQSFNRLWNYNLLDYLVQMSYVPVACLKSLSYFSAGYCHYMIWPFLWQNSSVNYYLQTYGRASHRGFLLSDFC